MSLRYSLGLVGSTTVAATLAVGCHVTASDTRLEDTTASPAFLDLTTYKADGPTLTAYRNLYTPAGKFCSVVQDTAASLGPNYISSTLPYHQLPIEELQSVVDYTGSAFYHWNSELRAGTTGQFAATQLRIKVAASGLNRLPNYSGLVFRGAKLAPSAVAKYVAALAAGTPIVEWAFTSTSLNLTSATGFGAVLYQIHSQRGHRIEGISSFCQEHEVVFVPGTAFDVNSVKSLDDAAIAKLAPATTCTPEPCATPGVPLAIAGCSAVSTNSASGAATSSDPTAKIGDTAGSQLLDDAPSQDAEAPMLSPKFYGKIGFEDVNDQASSDAADEVSGASLPVNPSLGLDEDAAVPSPNPGSGVTPATPAVTPTPQTTVIELTEHVQ